MGLLKTIDKCSSIFKLGNKTAAKCMLFVSPEVGRQVLVGKVGQGEALLQWKGHKLGIDQVIVYFFRAQFLCKVRKIPLPKQSFQFKCQSLKDQHLPLVVGSKHVLTTGETIVSSMAHKIHLTGYLRPSEGSGFSLWRSSAALQTQHGVEEHWWAFWG